MVKFKGSPKKRSEPSSPSDHEYTSYQNTRLQAKANNVAKKSTATVRQQQHHRRKPKMYTKVLKEIRLLQKTTSLCIPKAPFLRLVRHLLQTRCNRHDVRITEPALEAMREAAEALLVGVFEDSYLLALHAKRVTLMPKDLSLLLTLRHDELSESK